MLISNNISAPTHTARAVKFLPRRTRRVPETVTLFQEKNTQQPFMYNILSDLVKAYQKPAIFANKSITVSNVDRAFIKALKKTGLRF